MAYDNVGLSSDILKILGVYKETLEANLQNNTPVSVNIVTKTPVPSNVVSLASLSSLPSMRKWNGEKQLNKFKNAIATTKTQAYEGSTEVERSVLKSGFGAQYQNNFAAMGRLAGKYSDNILAELLTCGFPNSKEAYYPGVNSVITYDLTSTQPLFSTAHDTDPAGVQSNIVTGGITSTTVMTAYNKMLGFTGANGETLDIIPKYLVIPPQLNGDAMNAVNAQYAPGGSTTVPLSNQSLGLVEIVRLNKLSKEATVGYLVGEVSGMTAAQMYEFEAPHMTEQTAGSFSDFMYAKYLYSVEADATMVIPYWPMVIRITA